MMKAQRLWNQHAPHFVKQNGPLFLIILAITGLILGKYIFFSSPTRQIHPNLLCPSQDNYSRKDEYEHQRIHILPSIPERASASGRRSKTKDGTDKGDCVRLNIPEGSWVTICIHNPQKDLMVSAHVKRDGTWEKENVLAMSEALSQFPDLMLVDLGCNIGAFTLAAAKMGMEVVAVDSMLASLNLLQRSLLINGLSCPVTLLHNAMYSQRQELRVALDPSNIGGSQVLEILDFRRAKIPQDQVVDAICLDDLVPFAKGRDVFLKMDLESSEVEVLQCAHQFFTQVNVRVLLIEWLYYRHNEAASGTIKSFLLEHGMIPTWGVDLQRPIDVQASHSWPDNVFWMKQS